MKQWKSNNKKKEKKSDCETVVCNKNNHVATEMKPCMQSKGELSED